MAERGVRKGDLVAQRNGMSVYKEDFSPTVLVTGIVQASCPASGAAVYKSTLAKGLEKLDNLHDKVQ